MAPRKMLEAAAEMRAERLPAARRLYQEHRYRLPTLFRQLDGPTQEQHNWAFDLLAGMAPAIVGPLLEALADPTLPDVAHDEIVSLLGTAGDPQAIPALWDFFQAHQDDEERASTAALALAGLGDERVHSYVHDRLWSEDREVLANAVASLVMIGQLSDIPRLRVVHRQHLDDEELREGVTAAILAILPETSEHILQRTLDEIQASPRDQALWEDIWAALEESFGG